MPRVRLDMWRWLVFVSACGAMQPRSIENHRPERSLDDLSFLAGCWERVLDRGGVQRVRWTREERRWSGHYEQNGPMDVRVRANLTIRRAASGLEVVTSNGECRWETCLAPFDVHGQIDPEVGRYTVFGAGDSALWIGFERGRGHLLFGQAEANRFMRCQED